VQLDDLDRKEQWGRLAATRTVALLFEAGAALTFALQDRDLQHAADRHAGGERNRLHKLWMSGRTDGNL
jgi:hypothetical protein